MLADMARQDGALRRQRRVRARCAGARPSAASPRPPWPWPPRLGNAARLAVACRSPCSAPTTAGRCRPRYKDVQEKIGLLFSLRARTVCTAFCVAKDVVATAGHCLLPDAGERPPRLGDFWFARNYDAVRDIARIAGHANGTAAQQRHVGLDEPQRAPADRGDARTGRWCAWRGRSARRACCRCACCRSSRSWRRPRPSACSRSPIIATTRRGSSPTAQPCGVAKSFETRTGATIAQDFSDPEVLILHTCDTGGASSGSPMLLDTADGPR